MLTGPPPKFNGTRDIVDKYIDQQQESCCGARENGITGKATHSFPSYSVAQAAAAEGELFQLVD